MRKHVRNLILQALAVATVSAGTYGVVSASGESANAASPTVYGVRGIDTSHHNAHPIRWSAVKASGESFVFHKATQGTGYRDPKFAGDFAAALDAGLMAAPYHFYDSGTGAAQAAHFIRTVKAAGYDAKRPGQLPPVVDLERVKGRCPAGVNSAQIAAFLAKAREAFGVNPIVYTSKDFADTCLRGKVSALANSPLWQPRYKSGSTEPAPVGGRSWSIWQYTEHGSVPGISGHVDHNVYKGTLTQLRRLAHLASASGQPTPPRGNTTAATAKSWPVLKSGSRGTDVRTAQHLLNAAGHRLDADGLFGPATTGAVKAFQKRNGLNPDGIVGPNTWNKLIRTVRQGSSGEAVKAAQTQLAGYGHNIRIDGAFGPATASAVKAFQKRNGLNPDGIVGPNTWNKLVAGTTTSTPAPTTPAPSGNGKLTNRQALAQLAAAGINHPVGRTSLDGVRARTIQGVIALKKASGCTITITGGTESGHSNGEYSHAKGYKLDLRTRDEGRCVTNWIKNTQRKGKPRGNDPRWHGTLAGISLEYVYETPKRGGVHWDITFI
ncbi:peptidoglycan-binding protein [Streptomyces sp. NPDC001698]|uniref:peptidoglycan-binding protein n=1 Tax=Streptomyces sp. NPDC001698 TaxID=3364601 RepID=UPI003695F96A